MAIKIILAFSLFIGLAAFAEGGPEDHFGHLPQGGRQALHGMVVFGAGPYFLEHIPMLMPPHDFQIITQVILKDLNGTPLTADFSNQGFTMKPSESFSLNDFVAGRLKKFTASIHRGSFEQGGGTVPGLSEVSVEIVEYKLIRQLPADSQDKVLHLGEEGNAFESAIIRLKDPVQMIRNATTGALLWCVKGPDFFQTCD